MSFLIVILLVVLVVAFFDVIPAQKSTDWRTDWRQETGYAPRSRTGRRDWYRNVYLNSDAWRNKRYVVLRRDNWTCTSCGARATEVHHTRYLKNNLGKEPIDWLISVCRSCHQSHH